jgi:FkbM family methyltransferase
MKFVVEPGIGFSYAIGRELACPTSLMQRIKPGWVVYDVGANKGQMALAFSRAVGATGKVMAFEPAPREAKSLRANILRNGLNNVDVFELALYDSIGEVSFAYSDALPTQGKIAAVERSHAADVHQRITVPTTTMDALVLGKTIPPPDFIKIDTEGGAAAILRGAREVIQRHAPVFFVELHGPEEAAGVRDELLERGYRATDGEGRIVSDPVTAGLNAIWCERKRDH